MFGFFKSKPKLLNIKIKITAFIEKSDGGYIAYCPELRGLVAGGDTEKEVLDNFTECTIAYIKSLIKHNDPLPFCTTIQAKNLPKPKFTKDIEIPLPFIFDERLNKNCSTVV